MMIEEWTIMMIDMFSADMADAICTGDQQACPEDH